MAKAIYLELGGYCNVFSEGVIHRGVKLIRVTANGYNFLKEETNQCVLSRLIYAQKNRETNQPILLAGRLIFVPPMSITVEEAE